MVEQLVYVMAGENTPGAPSGIIERDKFVTQLEAAGWVVVNRNVRCAVRLALGGVKGSVYVYQRSIACSGSAGLVPRLKKAVPGSTPRTDGGCYPAWHGSMRQRVVEELVAIGADRAV